MNRDNLYVLNLFQHQKNAEKLLAAIVQKMPKSKDYIAANLRMHMKHFADMFSRDMIAVHKMNDIFLEVDHARQLKYINSMFIRQMIGYINDNVAFSFDEIYEINDGFKASGSSAISNMPRTQLGKDTRMLDDPLFHFQVKGNQSDTMQKVHENDTFRGEAKFRGNYDDEYKRIKQEPSANATLQKWYYPTRPNQLRDDTVGNINLRPNYGFADEAPTLTIGGAIPNGSHTPAGHKLKDNNIEYFGNHVDRLMNTSYIQGLNGDDERPNILSSTYSRGKDGAKICRSANPQDTHKLWQNGTEIVDESNPREMQKLMDRRINRTYNRPRNSGEPLGDRADEQIPYFVQSIHRRHYDRDAEESIGGFEFDAAASEDLTEDRILARGYGKDLDSLYCRVPKKEPCGREFKPTPGGYGQKYGWGPFEFNFQ